jgi:quercetin dioxygenase-like cupin family protein
MSDLNAVSTTQIDNEHVRVTEWRFAPGASTGHHRHGFDYVIVPMTTGQLAATTAEGPATHELVAGRPYFRSAGVEHDIRNANPFEFSFIEIELKSRAG